MLKLSSALHGWQPTEHAGRDPVVLLAAGWGEVLGDDVAANSAPLRIVNGTLLVMVRSSAWSHQLSFLSERILDAVGRAFRRSASNDCASKSGRSRSATAPRAAFRHRRRRKCVPIMSRRRPQKKHWRALRRPFTRRKERDAPEDGVNATAVGHSARGAAACHARRRLGRRGRLRPPACFLRRRGSVMAERPSSLRGYVKWSTSAFACAFYGAGGANWKEPCRRTPSRDGRERLIASSYVLLRSKLPPERIAPATVRSVLGDQLHALLYGDEHNG